MRIAGNVERIDAECSLYAATIDGQADAGGQTPHCCAGRSDMAELTP
jgi:hypothetical protein